MVVLLGALVMLAAIQMLAQVSDEIARQVHPARPLGAVAAVAAIS